jgi:hypothetical protein
MSLCLAETIMQSPTKDRERGAVPAGVRTPKDALRSALKSCRRVSVVGTNVFVNWADLSTSGLLLGFPDSRSRLRGGWGKIKYFRHTESERLRFQ